MTEPVCIKELSDISLDSHGVIEASAGTGKTYTIKKIFTRLLLEKNIEVDQILVMTFTEKATSELKADIRKDLSESLKEENNPKNKEILSKAIISFDKAQIYTIHGFCNNLINEYPFENSLYFKNSIIDDSLIYQKIIYQLMRSEWGRIYKDALLDVLSVSELNNSWLNKAIEIAKKYNDIDEIKDQIIPPYDENFYNKIIEIKKELETIDLIEVSDALEIDSINNIDDSPIANLINISVNGRSLNKYKKLLNLFIAFLKTKEKNFFNYFKFALNFKEEYKTTDYIIKNVKREKLELFSNNSTIILIKDTIESMLNVFNDIDYIANQLLSNSIVDLKKLTYQYKKENAFLSFDDLLKTVYYSLSNSNELKVALQKKFKYALIDEFQDTDKLQWEIIKKIFIESNGNFVYLIGDPKQAIYSFRGADIYTYLKARDFLLTKKKANYYFLNKNFRSNKNIVETLNILFGFNKQQRSWFTDNRIKLISSEAANENIITIGNEANNMVCLMELENQSKAYYTIADFIVNEIKKLSKENLTEHKNKITRELKFSDIAILTRKTKEQKIIEEKLKEANIPYSIYKKSELYKTEEAFNLSIILDAISGPADQSKFKKALLTEFFNFKAESLLAANEEKNISKISKLFNKWNSLAIEKKWEDLFLSIIEDTGIFLKIEIDGKEERKITNYKHIIEKLMAEAREPDTTIFSIVKKLNNLIISNSEEIDSDLQRIETEEPKVKIMTIHAAKGLQFPVVFIFAGLSSDKHQSYYKFYDEQIDKNSFDLIRMEDNKGKYEEEKKREDQRLYYVALTRAISLLYIPYIPNQNITTFSSLINNNVIELIEKKLINVIHLENSEFKEKEIQDKLFYKNRNNELDIDDNFLTPVIAKENIVKDQLFSFSSLTKNKKKYDINNIEIPYNIKKDDEEDSFANEVEVENDPLPSGSEIGLIFHEIMEELEFNKISEASLFENSCYLKNIIDEKIKKVSIYSNRIKKEKVPLIKDELFSIIHKTVNKELGNEKIILNNIQQKDIIKEFEFYYTVKSFNNKEDIYINGFIDMLFRYNDKYFIIDWKSNKLENYDFNSLEKEMKKNRYDIQAKIYFISVIKWLKKVINDFNYDKNFGGIFYIFVRGINNENDNGIYFFRPESINLIEEYTKEINSLILLKGDTT